jgi:hypothetical protein
MRGKASIALLASVLLLAAPASNAHAARDLVARHAPSAVSAAGSVREAGVGQRRAGARLAGVRVPEVRLASISIPVVGDVGDVLDIGKQAVCGVICFGVDLAKKVGGKGVSAIGDVAGDIAQSALDQLAEGVAAGGAWMMRKTARVIQRTTTPVLSARWFQERYREMRRVAVLFAVLAFLSGVIGAMVARDGVAMFKTVFVRLPLAFGLTAVLAVIAQMGVEAADSITAGFAQDFTTDVGDILRVGAKGMISLTAHTAGAGGAGMVVPAIITIMVGLFSIATAFVLWLELLVRDAGIYVVVFLSPLVLAAMIWERCVPLLTRTLWVLTALILSKPLIVALMSLASAGLAYGVPDQGLSLVLPVLVLMMLACLTPFALLGLVPLLEGIGGHHGAKRSLTAMGSSAASAAGSGGGHVMRAAMQEHFSSSGNGAFDTETIGSSGGAQAAGAGAAGGGAEAGAGAGLGPAVVASAAVQAGSALRSATVDAAREQAERAQNADSGTSEPSERGSGTVSSGSTSSDQAPRPAVDLGSTQDGLKGSESLGGAASAEASGSGAEDGGVPELGGENVIGEPGASGAAGELSAAATGAQPHAQGQPERDAGLGGRDPGIEASGSTDLRPAGEE